MKQIIYFGLFALTFVSCGHKYELINMLPETNDITSYIESGQYRADSCEGRLDRLIKQKPLILNNNYENILQGKLVKWKNEYNSWLLKYNRDTINFKVDKLVNKTKYQYTYFITNEPIDVYRTDLGIEINRNKNFKLFIRFDTNDKIYSDFNEQGWIINSCDSVNSIIQNIYGHKK